MKHPTGGRSNPRLGAKLYRDPDHDGQWIAWSRNIGWVRFPACPNGWTERKPAGELDTSHLREVSLAQALDTALIEAFRATLLPQRPGTKAASDIDAP